MHFTPDVFWPYFGAFAALLIGLARFRQAPAHAAGMDLLVVLAPVFVAIAMAVFGADHLVEPKAVAQFVPKWMFAREFWAVFVGIALVAAALGLTTGIWANPAAGFLGGMILCFALLIYLPIWLRGPGNRVWQTLVLRDLTLGSAYLAFGVRKAHSAKVRRLVPLIARIVVAVGIFVYGIRQFTNPEAAPGIPQDGTNLVTMPAWIPAPHAWSYATGAIFIGCALLLILARKVARHAAFVLGAAVTVLVVVVYLPVTVAKPADIDNGLNYLAIHFALAGALVMLSVALRESGAEAA